MSISDIIAAIAALFQSPETAAANQAKRRLAQNNANIADAEALLKSMKAQRIEDAKADAAALEVAIANATTEAEKAEIRRQGEIDRINNATDKRIKALEDAIAAARQVGNAKLGRLAEKQSAARDAEQARIEGAEAALDEVGSVADSK